MAARFYFAAKERNEYRVEIFFVFFAFPCG
jgi:hypothetical protein